MLPAPVPALMVPPSADPPPSTTVALPLPVPSRSFRPFFRRPFTPPSALPVNDPVKLPVTLPPSASDFTLVALRRGSMSGLAGKEVCRRGCIRGRLEDCCEELDGAGV